MEKEAPNKSIELRVSNAPPEVHSNYNNEKIFEISIPYHQSTDEGSDGKIAFTFHINLFDFLSACFEFYSFSGETQFAILWKDEKNHNNLREIDSEEMFFEALSLIAQTNDDTKNPFGYFYLVWFSTSPALVSRSPLRTYYLKRLQRPGYCTECGIFYGHSENKCSTCYRKSFFTEKEKALDARAQLAKTPLRNEELEEWVGTGIHEKQEHQTCSICLEENKLIISNYACDCVPVTCVSCNVKIDRCPVCRTAGKYRRIPKDEIIQLLSTNYSNAAKLHIVSNALHEGYTLPFKFDQLICHAADIDEIFLSTSLENENGGEKMNSVYCLAVDFWKTQNKFASVVLCYKGFWVHDPNYVTSYKEICKHRKNGDFSGLMETEATD